MDKLKIMLKNWKIVLLIIVLFTAIFIIRPSPFNKGVVILSVEKNSSAELAGMQSPKAGILPLAKEKIVSINNIPVNTVDEYYEVLSSVQQNKSLQVKTNKGIYRLASYRLASGADKVQDIGLTISPAPTTNLRKGLDLQGGTRVVLEPAEPVNDDVIAGMIESMEQRLNVYGLTDIIITSIKDRTALLGGGEDTFILVEIAGATEQTIKDLLAKQGKFEAKIGNKTVFMGGENDITYVCKTAQCSGIDPRRACGKAQDGYFCSFYFQITLSPDAAKKQADITQTIPVAEKDGEKYLAEQLVLFLDDQEVDSLNIGADLKGRAITDISISGPGSGVSLEAAKQSALENMKKLQAIMETGSFPVKLDIVRIDTISPVLGTQFIRNAFILALLSIGAVFLILLAVYKSFKVACAIIFTAISEVTIVLGMAALIGWNIDLAAIAGIIIAVGTGVNDQIVITDETLRKEKEGKRNWKESLKKAFSIIMSAYLTIMVAMIPLLFAGAGLLKGFAITTMLAVTGGVLVTRPAYAEFIKILFEEE